MNQECFMDPDISIPWSDVAEVIVPSSDCSEDSCPICLIAPNVPKITHCGHIFWYV